MQQQRVFFLFAILSFACRSAAQYVPVPAPAQSQPIVIRGATAHLGNGQVIENSVVAFVNGKITVVDRAAANRQFPGHRDINAAGQHLYPGLIACNSTLGLQEIEAVRATADATEIGDLNPNVRSLPAYSTDSEVTPTVRSMGVLLAEVAPQGGRIAGTSSVVQLDAWNWQEAAYATDLALHLHWPSLSTFNGREQRWERNENYENQVRELESFFEQAQAYHRKATVETANLRLASLSGLFDARQRLFLHADQAAAIREAVLFAKKFQLKPVIVGGNDAWMLTDFLKKNQVAIILNSTQRLPTREDEDIDQPFKTPGLLQAAGVEWCFSHEGFWQQRNLVFQAGQAVSFGLSKEEALTGLTLAPAKILGIEKRTGSLEAGKDANLFLCAGDVLDVRTSKVTQAFIQGREINLDNKQEMLYRRFQMKYGK